MIEFVQWRGKRLHIGCGAKYLEGWVNSDGLARPVVEGSVGRPDVVLDLYQDLVAIPTGSLIHIYWSHGPEHIWRDRLVGVLAELHRILSVGGTLTLAAPSIRGIWEHRYTTQEDGPYWNEAIYGGTDSTNHPFESHKQIFDGPLMYKILTLAGFRGDLISDWEPEKYPEILALDDYSVTARKISLLMEAIK